MANSDLSFALELADLAADVSMKTFRCAELTVETKADGSPVTEVDRTVEGVLRDALARYHPSDGVVGEEFGGEPGGGRCWYLDPIEGTTLYIEGSLHWSTLISLAVDGVVTTAVVDYPAAERRCWAVRGDGAFANGDPMQASTVSRLEEATVCDDYRHNIERSTRGTPLFDWLATALRCNLPPKATRSSWWHAVKLTSLSTPAAVPGITHPLCSWLRKPEVLRATLRANPVLTVAHSSSLTVVFTVRPSPPWVHSRGQRRLDPPSGITPCPGVRRHFRAASFAV